MLAPSPTTHCGPIETRAPSRALGATLAVGCTPAGWETTELNSCDTRANTAYGLSATSRGRAVNASFCGARITAGARVLTRWALYRGLAKNAISPSPARSSVPTCWIRVSGSPATRPPRREAISPSVSGPGMASLGRRLAFQRLDHLVGDVDARAHVGRHLLEDDVELLLLGDLADHAVRLLHHLRELLVAPLVDVLAEFPLFSLELAIQIAELALLRPPLALAHGHRVLVQVLLHALQLLGGARQLVVALLEFGLELALRAHRRHRVSQDALGAHEGHFAGGLLRGRRRKSAGQRRGEKQCLQSHRFRSVPQNTVPKVNCNL